MDLQAAEAAAEADGVVLVKCEGCESGFKGVFSGDGRWRSRYWSRRKKGYVQLALCDSRFEAALQLAQQLRWTSPCECPACTRAAAPPALPPPTKQEVEADAAAKRLTLAPGNGEGGYKGIVLVHNSNPRRYTVGTPLIAELALDPPGRAFETAHEAAYWLAERLGPDGSADFAAGRASWTQQEISDALLQTADGRAFGGTVSKSLFGGFACDFCPRKPAGEGCGLLFRSAHAARLQGQHCEEEAWSGGADVSWDLRHPHRGPARRMIPGGTYRCSHRTAAGGCCAFQLDGIPIYGNFEGGAGASHDAGAGGARDFAPQGDAADARGVLRGLLSPRLPGVGAQVRAGDVGRQRVGLRGRVGLPKRQEALPCWRG